MLSLKTTLIQAKELLKPLPMGALDAEILLAHVLKVDRAYLYTWPEKHLSSACLAAYFTLVGRRQAGEPVAYLTGFKEFFGLQLKVTPATLIPRPETEMLVEEALARLPCLPLHLLELGTGSGAISIALALQRPQWRLTATDLSAAALQVAQENMFTHGLTHIQCWQSNWYEALPSTARYHAILSNPPYIAPHRPELSQELRFEPQTALISADEGLYDLTKIVQDAPSYLEPAGFLFLEHGYDQGQAVRNLLQSTGFESVTCQDLTGYDRITIGKLR